MICRRYVVFVDGSCIDYIWWVLSVFCVSEVETPRYSEGWLTETSNVYIGTISSVGRVRGV